MKHSIRQRVLDPVTGLMVTKIETVNGELGSGIVDKNGREIFEGDIIQFTNGSQYTVKFINGSQYTVKFNYSSFVATNGWRVHDLAALKTSEAEIIGHVDD